MRNQAFSNAPRIWAALAVVVSSSAAVAQPPTYSRWTSAAQSQPQGFSQGSPLRLTWGFMALGTTIVDSSYPTAGNNLQTRLNTIYGSQAVWQPLFQSVFDRWSSISGLTYTFANYDDGAAIGGSNGFPAGVLNVRADVRIGGKPLNGNSGVLAYNYYPNVGEMVFDTNDNFYNDTSNGSIRLRNVTAHEHGHGVGMPHMDSNNASFLMEPFYSGAFNGPQYHDILAAQHMYGDANERSNAGLGNDTAPRATNLGTVAGGAPRTVGNSARTLGVPITATDFVSIDSQTDTDFYRFDVTLGGQINVLLEALGFTYNITPQNAGGNVAFDSRLRNNLALALLGTDGTTVLQSANLNGLGGNESILFNLLTGGTYYLRITGANNADSIALDTQFYGLTLNFAPVPEPGALGLIAAAGVGAFGWRRLRRRRTAA